MNSTPVAMLLVALAALVGAGCGSSESAAPTSGTASPAPASADGGQAEDAAVDACGLVSNEEVGALIGVTVDGVPSGAGGRSACTWENPDTYESVTVDIGAPGTASDDTLPPLGEPGFAEMESTPGPNGTRLVAGAVEFAAGNRYNSVQVATPTTMSPDESIAAANELVAKITPLIPA
jgi:hypothetical protein